MITTPDTFVPLLAAIERPRTLTFAFRGNELLIRESDASLPGEAALAAMALDDTRFQPVGLWNDDYCRAAWLPLDSTAPEGHTRGSRGRAHERARRLPRAG